VLRFSPRASLTSQRVSERPKGLPDPRRHHNPNPVRTIHHVVSPTKRIPSLDGLRALSITVVVASHMIKVVDPKDPSFNPLWAIAANGQIGVAIFFCNQWIPDYQPAHG